MSDITKAINFLKQKDPILKRIIDSAGGFNMELDADYFHSLVRSIVFQQLSGKAAGTILKRLEVSMDFKITPEKCFSTTSEHYRTLGLSKQKASYIIDLSKNFLEDPEGFLKLEELSDQDITAKLTAVKGIGVWTAQMFLMFTLLRMDVFPADDLGIKKAMINHYHANEKPKKEELETISEKWKPYRTIASWYLWRTTDADFELK